MNSDRRYENGPFIDNDSYMTSFVIERLPEGHYFWTATAINKTRKGSRVSRSGSTQYRHEAFAEANAARNALLVMPA